MVGSVLILLLLLDGDGVRVDGCVKGRRSESYERK